MTRAKAFLYIVQRFRGKLQINDIIKVGHVVYLNDVERKLKGQSHEISKAKDVSMETVAFFNSSEAEVLF